MRTLVKAIAKQKQQLKVMDVILDNMFKELEQELKEKEQRDNKLKKQENINTNAYEKMANYIIKRMGNVRRYGDIATRGIVLDELSRTLDKINELDVREGV